MMIRKYLSIPVAVAALLGAGVMSAEVAAQAGQGNEVYELGEIFVVGTRRPVRSTADTPAPIDLIAAEDFTDQGSTALPNVMRTLVPSYNVNTQPISDAATFIRPANLRGLAPDQTLVFVNGKRRHRAAVITWLGHGLSDGAQGPDIGVIPAIALKRVEVLRDTASAQYGSDAIAGVMNFVLKDRPDGGIAEAQWGQTWEGDGAQNRFAGNIGIPIADSGFGNLSVQWRSAEPTSRSVQRDDAAALIAGGNPHVRTPHAQIWGQPDTPRDYTIFLNTGVDLTEDVEAYAFGNISNRETEGGFFFRNPNTRSGVNTYRDENGDRFRLVGDLTPDDGLSCPTGIPVADTSEYFDVESFKRQNPGCFMFNERFPGGFTPQFAGEVTDHAGAAGLRGSLPSGLIWDISYTRGQSKIDFSMRDTINPSLGPDTPTQFELGSYAQTEQVANLDLIWPLDIAAFASPLNVAGGLEWRSESFEIEAGEEASWKIGPLADQGFGVGANGFSGFADHVAGKWTQSSTAGYLDLEADVNEALTLGTMGRVEAHENFDTTTDFKVAARVQMNDQIGVRGSASTGFRAPTVGQQNTLNVTTEFYAGELSQLGTLRPTCAEARIVGATPLQPEESVTFTVGAIAEAGPFSLTADFYNIDVDGRISLSENKSLSTEQIQRVAAEGGGCVPGDVRNVRFFGNGVDTRTQGVDLVVSVDVPLSETLLAGGESEFLLAGNWNRTEVRSFNPDFIDNRRIFQLENSIPAYRFNATVWHRRDQWRAFARVNYYGPYTTLELDDLGLRQEFGAEFTLDAEFSYMLAPGMDLSVGAENILNEYPDRSRYSGIAGATYPESSVFGFSGGFYYARARYVF